MNERRPPSFATWLLRRVGLTGRDAPLVGDLLEEFRSRRSAGWFWRQTLVAMAIGWARKFPLTLPLRQPGFHRMGGSGICGADSEAFPRTQSRLQHRPSALPPRIALARRHLEPYVGGWRNVPGDIPGPWWYQAWRRISTPVLAAADNEFLTDMFCYLLVTSLIPLSIGILAGVKIGWLATSKSEVRTNA